MQKRASGVLLHITSLPSEYGIGDLGPPAYRFADFLAKAGQSYWQVLPLTPPATEIHGSPYSSISAFAGNPLLISPQLLKEEGLLTDLNKSGDISYKTKLLNTAYKRFKQIPDNPAYDKFCANNGFWLEDFALFAALREHFNRRLWSDWPRKVRDREKTTLESLRDRLGDAIDKEKFLQYHFFKQWFALKHYCNERKIQIIGDIPIYLAYDSADVWSNPQIFKLTAAKKPQFVSGVPPDHFSKTGQLWGNPVYNWQALKANGYNWWIERLKHNLALFDIVRIDHFIGFISYWQVPAHHKTAAKGKWLKGPGEDFFRKLLVRFPSCPFIVEDLGPLGPAVNELVEKFRLPPTRVLQFGFGGKPATNPHRPYNLVKNSVFYTSTHDSNTVKGWFEKEVKDKQAIFNYIGRKVSAGQIHWELIRLVMSAVSYLVIIPLQDILGLGKEARMNVPATTKGNWKWRFRAGQISDSIAKKLSKLTRTFGRI